MGRFLTTACHDEELKNAAPSTHKFVERSNLEHKCNMHISAEQLHSDIFLRPLAASKSTLIRIRYLRGIFAGTGTSGNSPFES